MERSLAMRSAWYVAMVPVCSSIAASTAPEMDASPAAALLAISRNCTRPVSAHRARCTGQPRSPAGSSRARGGPSGSARTGELFATASLERLARITSPPRSGGRRVQKGLWWQERAGVTRRRLSTRHTMTDWYQHRRERCILMVETGTWQWAGHDLLAEAGNFGVAPADLLLDVVSPLLLPHRLLLSGGRDLINLCRRTIHVKRPEMSSNCPPRSDTCSLPSNPSTAYANATRHTYIGPERDHHTAECSGAGVCGSRR